MSPALDDRVAIATEDLGEGVLLATFRTNRLGLFGRDDAPELFEFVERVDRDPQIRAVVFTGSHPSRFISHADLSWLQEDGAVIPPVSRRVTSMVARMARLVDRSRLSRWLARRTLLTGALQLDFMHRTLTRMTTSSTIFVAALNGSTLGLGAEISWACDLRLMAEGDFFIGHLEVLLGFPPGAGGTQRLPRLIGSHRALVAILEGRPFTAEEALTVGAIDEIVAAEHLVDRAAARARELASRPTEAIAAIKRSVNLGGSMTLAKGLHLERTEFLAALPQRQAQELMLGYLQDTAEHGELMLYRDDGYAAALRHGKASLETKTERVPS